MGIKLVINLNIVFGNYNPYRYDRVNNLIKLQVKIRNFCRWRIQIALNFSI